MSPGQLSVSVIGMVTDLPFVNVLCIHSEVPALSPEPHGEVGSIGSSESHHGGCERRHELLLDACAAQVPGLSCTSRSTWSGAWNEMRGPPRMSSVRPTALCAADEVSIVRKGLLDSQVRDIRAVERSRSVRPAPVLP